MIKENQKLLNRIQVVLDAGVIIVASVSYTHLDVYKRQALFTVQHGRQ